MPKAPQLQHLVQTPAKNAVIDREKKWILHAHVPILIKGAAKNVALTMSQSLISRDWRLRKQKSINF